MRRIARMPRARRRSAHCLSAGPTRSHWPDEAIDVGSLSRRRLGLSRARRIEAGGHAGVDRHERVAVEDTDQTRVPADADLLAQPARAARDRRRRRLRRGHRVDGALATPEARNALAASGCSAGCSTSRNWVQTWRRVVR